MPQKNEEVARALGLALYTLPTSGDGIQTQRDRQQSIESSGSPSRMGDLTDEEFEQLASLLPPEPQALGAAPNIAVINALLWSRQRSRCLTQLPSSYGISPEAARKRWERWCIARVGERILAVLDTLQFSNERREQLRSLCIDQVRRGSRIRNLRTKA